jgi:hypothetical protein
MIICLNCGFIKEPEDEGDYCAFCLTELYEDYDNEFFDILETDMASVVVAKVE